MDRFVWLGDHVVNLDAVAYFKIENDGRVRVMLRGIPDGITQTIEVDGEKAAALVLLLKEQALLAPQEFSDPKNIILVRLEPEGQVVAEKVVEIDTTRD
jgi:hypothetical protein